MGKLPSSSTKIYYFNELPVAQLSITKVELEVLVAKAYVHQGLFERYFIYNNTSAKGKPLHE